MDEQAGSFNISWTATPSPAWVATVWDGAGHMAGTRRFEFDEASKGSALTLAHRWAAATLALSGEDASCPKCGEELDLNGACWNRTCPDGAANIGDRQYHEAVDREAMAFFERGEC